MLSLEARAKQHGLDVQEIGDRTEIRKGKSFLAFHSDPEKALKMALDRMEQDRVKALRKEETEPVLTGNEAKELVKKYAKKKKILAVAEVAAAEVPIDPPLPDVPLAEQMQVVHGPVIKGSIIKKHYKDRYKKNGNYSCGDDLADELRAYIEVRVGTRIAIDLKKLREVAEKNEVWNERYLGLNAGQQRMTIGNRLRSRMKQGDQLDIGGAILQAEFADI